MRIAFDVSPMSHERAGVNNYILGSLRGLAEAARATGDEVVAFAPTSPEGRVKAVIQPKIAATDPAKPAAPASRCPPSAPAAK